MRYREHRVQPEDVAIITLFVIGLVAVAVGPALTILMDRGGAPVASSGNISAGMFVALNDNAASRHRRVA